MGSPLIVLKNEGIDLCLPIWKMYWQFTEHFRIFKDIFLIYFVEVAVDPFPHIRGDNGSHVSGDTLSVSRKWNCGEKIHRKCFSCHMTTERLEGTGVSKSQAEATEKKQAR